MGGQIGRVREEGFRRSGRITRIVATGSLVLTALFAWVAAHGFSGRAAATPNRSRAALARRAPRFSNDDGFTPPAQPPSPAADGFAAPVVSGGS